MSNPFSSRCSVLKPLVYLARIVKGSKRAEALDLRLSEGVLPHQIRHPSPNHSVSKQHFETGRHFSRVRYQRMPVHDRARFVLIVFALQFCPGMRNHAEAGFEESALS